MLVICAAGWALVGVTAWAASLWLIEVDDHDLPDGSRDEGGTR